MSALQDRVWIDPELADLVRDDPRLVAIADALRETEGIVAPRRRRRLALRGALLAAALCIGLVLALVAPWSNSGNGTLADRALAAIGTLPVLHVVVELAPQSQLICARHFWANLGNGHRFAGCSRCWGEDQDR